MLGDASNMYWMPASINPDKTQRTHLCSHQSNGDRTDSPASWDERCTAPRLRELPFGRSAQPLPAKTTGGDCAQSRTMRPFKYESFLFVQGEFGAGAVCAPIQLYEMLYKPRRVAEACI